LHFYLYILHFSSHLTRNNQKIAFLPLFSSFFIAFNKKHSKNCIISFIFFFFHRIQQETFQNLHYFLFYSFIFFIFHRIQQETFKKIALFSSFFIAFNKKHSKNCIISFIFFIFHRIQQETFKKIALFSSFFIAFNKKHSKNCIISFVFFFFHRIY
jgi:hypothetical protein